MFPKSSLYLFLKNSFVNANNGVEAFFIISGFLFVLTFKQSVSFIQFFVKKYFRLAPVIIFGTLLFAIASLFDLWDFTFKHNILTMLLLNNFIVRWSNGDVGSVWYVSALFSVFFIYFPLKKYVSNFKVYMLISSALTVIAYAILEYLRGGNFGHPGLNVGIFNIGFLRAVGGVGLGILCGEIYNLYSKNILACISNLPVIVITLLEFISLGFITVWIACIHPKMNNIVFVFVFVLLFLLFLLKQGYVSKFFEKDIWVSMAKYVYSIFVTHTIVYKLFSYNFWVNHVNFVEKYYWFPVIVNFVLVVLLGVFAYHFVEAPVVKIYKKLSNKII